MNEHLWANSKKI